MLEDWPSLRADSLTRASLNESRQEFQYHLKEKNYAKIGWKSNLVQKRYDEDRYACGKLKT